MNRDGSVRVPAGLRRNLEAVILNSPTVLGNCPFGHDVEVSIQIRYVPKGSPRLNLKTEIQRKRVRSGPKMVELDTPFTDQDFEQLLESPFQAREKRFIRFFQQRQNEAASPAQWMREGFRQQAHIKAINALCRRHRLAVRFAEAGEYSGEKGVHESLRLKYQFYMLEPVRKARG